MFSFFVRFSNNNYIHNNLFNILGAITIQAKLYDSDIPITYIKYPISKGIAASIKSKTDDATHSLKKFKLKIGDVVPIQIKIK